MPRRGFQLGTPYASTKQITGYVDDIVSFGARIYRHQITNWDAGEWDFEKYSAWWRNEISKVAEVAAYIDHFNLPIKIVVDCHTQYGGETMHDGNVTSRIVLFEDYRRKWELLWLEAIEFLKVTNGYKHIWAFDLVNEPRGDFDRVIGVQRRLARKVRHITNKRIIVSIAQGMRHRFTQIEPFPIRRCMYQFHFYWPADLTYYGVDRYSTQKAHQAAKQITRRGVRRQVREVRRWQRKHRQQIFVGEVGCSKHAGHGFLHDYFDTVLGLFNRYRWHWCIHAYREHPIWDVMQTEAANTVIRRLNQ